MMLKMGFASCLVQLIMKCVSTIKFSIKLNGKLLKPFTPTRGIRQGYPISPFLFLFCGEGLMALLHHYNGGVVDRGVRVCARAPWISHLLFADDSLIFINADDQKCLQIG